MEPKLLTIEACKKMSTTRLLMYFKKIRQLSDIPEWDWFGTDKEKEEVENLYCEIKAELNTREHVPRKGKVQEWEQNNSWKLSKITAKKKKR